MDNEIAIMTVNCPHCNGVYITMTEMQNHHLLKHERVMSEAEADERVAISLAKEEKNRTYGSTST